MRAGRKGEGGRGLGTSNLSATEGVDGDTGFFDDTICNGCHIITLTKSMIQI